MTEVKVKKIISTGYIKPTGDDWYNMVVGTIFGLCIYGSTAVLIVMKLGAVRPFNWITLLIILVIIVLAYWTDGKIKIVNTGLTKDENRDLLNRIFKKLDWPTKVFPNEIEIKDSKYILKFVHATIVYTDNFIGYNFQYASIFKSGRPAFFIGIRTYLRSKFQRKLYDQLKQSKNHA